MSLTFQGLHLAFLHDTTPEIDLEGALGSGKTIVALWKELLALDRYPGMWSFITRWSEDDVHKLLRPEFERLVRIRQQKGEWNNKEGFYEFPNGSRCIAFGLRTTAIDPNLRYGKIRGLPVSRIYVDQAEQLPPDFPTELRRRLRPNIEAKLRGDDFPTQLTFTPNPTEHSHWLGRQFPDGQDPLNKILPMRKYYALSLLDNAHNLPTDLVKAALLEYPPDHPNHRMKILGKRRELLDMDALAKKPFPPDSAGFLFEQAKLEAARLARW